MVLNQFIRGLLTTPEKAVATRVSSATARADGAPYECAKLL